MTGDATYVRNRRHLLQTPETYTAATSAEDPPAATEIAPPSSLQHVAVGPEVTQGQQPVTVAQGECQNPALSIMTLSWTSSVTCRHSDVMTLSQPTLWLYRLWTLFVLLHFFSSPLSPPLSLSFLPPPNKKKKR